MEEVVEAKAKALQCERCRAKYERHDVVGASRWCLECASLRLLDRAKTRAGALFNLGVVGHNGDA